METSKNIMETSKNIMETSKNIMETSKTQPMEASKNLKQTFSFFQISDKIKTFDINVITREISEKDY